MKKKDNRGGPGRKPGDRRQVKVSFGLYPEILSELDTKRGEASRGEFVSRNIKRMK